MTNPILQMLNPQNSNTLTNRVSEIRNAIGGQPIPLIYNQMMRTNPAFSNFVQHNRGKSIETLAGEFGVDIGVLNNLLK